LSAEEADVLKSTRNKDAFPIFIKGRAGSGKSTILQYIFADFFIRYLLSDEQVKRPAYFTYNKRLLDNAKQVVEKLLKHNTALSNDKIKKRLDSDKKVLDESFNEFQDYLLSLIPDDSSFKYSKSKYINYAKFC
jgi:guanylate kinase